MKSPACARNWRYSARYLPAWRIIQIGLAVTASPDSTRKIGLVFRNSVKGFQSNLSIYL
jgi:hypothetical protein